MIYQAFIKAFDIASQGINSSWQGQPTQLGLGAAEDVRVIGWFRGAKGAWWHPVTLVYAVLVGAAPLLPPQVNVPQLLLCDLALRVAVPGAPGLYPDKMDVAPCTGPMGQCPQPAQCPACTCSGTALPHAQGHPAASGLLRSHHGLCLQSSGWEMASSMGSGRAQPGTTVWDVSSHSRVTPLHSISDLLL